MSILRCCRPHCTDKFKLARLRASATRFLCLGVRLKLLLYPMPIFVCIEREEAVDVTEADVCCEDLDGIPFLNIRNSVFNLALLSRRFSFAMERRSTRQVSSPFPRLNC